MTKVLSRKRLAHCADWLVVAIAVALPWSTTLTGVFIALWVITLVASWDIAQRLREPWRAAGVLPVALWAFALAGILWAPVPLADRIDGLNAFHKLLAIPFLAIQFRDCGRGMRVLVGFLISCIVLLLVSWSCKSRKVTSLEVSAYPPRTTIRKAPCSHSAFSASPKVCYLPGASRGVAGRC